MRIALLGEGSGETERLRPNHPATGERLPPELWGPAHLLVCRLVAHVSSVPESATFFVAPLRTTGGRIARGSNLHRPQTLRRLLNYPVAARTPDLVVVLVDEDGDDRRLSTLRNACRDLTQPHVIAVAVREFESWLLADHQALHAVVGVCPIDDAPDSHPPGRAKQILSGHLASLDDARSARLDLARRADLDLVSQRSPSFRRFADDVRGALRDLGHARG